MGKRILVAAALAAGVAAALFPRKPHRVDFPYRETQCPK